MRSGWVGGLLLVLAFAAPAAGHTTLEFASPGPGMRVSGDVDRIQLGFADPIFNPRVSLFDPDGGAIQGAIEMIDDRTIAFVMEPLVGEGEYVLQYRVTAPDDDDQPDLASAFAFTYLGPDTSSGSNWLYYAGVALVLMSIGGFAAWRVSRIPPQDQAGASS